MWDAGDSAIQWQWKQDDACHVLTERQFALPAQLANAKHSR
jgi:hypothetical protein